jgi:FlaA1/EpsC-like NDP-sugar epimerase
MRPTSIFFPLAYAAAPRRLGRVGVPLVDAGCWAVALTGATWLRYEFDFGQADLAGLARITAATVAIAWIAGAVTRIHLGRFPIGSLDEALGLAGLTAVVCLAALGMDMACGIPPVPRSVPLIAAFLALALSVAARLAVRRCLDRRRRPDPRSARRVIVYGAGTRGRELVRAMVSGSAGNTLPVALLDDDPALRNSRIHGVPVRGTWRELVAVAGQTGARGLVVAFGNPAPAKIRAVKALARTAGLDVKTLPSLSEQLRPWTRLTDLRNVDVTELLGRQPVETDLESVSGCLRGKRVLVTGAGGSIGSELCRQIHRFQPAELFMLDRDETALHGVQLSIHGEARLDSPSLVLADIRDAEAMHGLFRQLSPDLVFHAAALKHLPVLERHPEEAWKTNVVGTLNVVDAARQAGVRRFVNISTDKAANPTSVLGRSKRIAERLVADAAGRTEGVYLSVRFGNVLGSRGSVLTTFAEQLAAGRPVTVTHPEVTRFFMTVPEAVQLVIQAAAIGASGEALVLDMGAPARIRELAEQLIAMSGSDSRIVFTGLGPGEKLHEEVFGEGEQDYRPAHPAISHIQVPPLPSRIVMDRHRRFGAAAAMAELVECPRIVVPRTGSPVEMDRVGSVGRSGKRVEPR